MCSNTRAGVHQSTQRRRMLLPVKRPQQVHCIAFAANDFEIQVPAQAIAQADGVNRFEVLFFTLSVLLSYILSPILLHVTIWYCIYLSSKYH